ncbi:LacI family DNA-binding transcriptional regulator [Martelella mangrovi]|uniref:DNA-binding LacI/PurR family transcriptional regulator n=1 Tax=Martelella mangrovi TaxID=1397477 RepID=A0ABV2IDI2_9HYPH
MTKKAPTIKDVARKSGTSTATVSYVFSEKDRYIRPELRERVLQAAEELGYVKNAVASSLKGNPRGILAVIIPQFSNNFFTDICAEIESVAQKAGFVVIICNTDDSVEQEEKIVKRLVSQKIDGCIICPALSTSKNIKTLDIHNIPYVVLERDLEGETPDFDFVGHDNFQSGYLATKTLLDAGHRNIAFLGWTTPIANLRDRLSGYKAALDEAGIAVNDDWILLDNLSEDAGKRMAARLPVDKVTAMVLAHHYYMAKGTLLGLQKRALRYPEDLSIVLIGTPEWRDLVHPSLTCIKRPEKEMGRAAASVLLKKVKKPLYREKRHVFPVEFMTGLSVRDMPG